MAPRRQVQGLLGRCGHTDYCHSGRPATRRESRPDRLVYGAGTANILRDSIRFETDVGNKETATAAELILTKPGRATRQPARDSHARRAG